MVSAPSSVNTPSGRAAAAEKAAQENQQAGQAFDKASSPSNTGSGFGSGRVSFDPQGNRLVDSKIEQGKGGSPIFATQSNAEAYYGARGIANTGQVVNQDLFSQSDIYKEQQKESQRQDTASLFTDSKPQEPTRKSVDSGNSLVRGSKAEQDSMFLQNEKATKVYNAKNDEKSAFFSPSVSPSTPKQSSIFVAPSSQTSKPFVAEKQSKPATNYFVTFNEGVGVGESLSGKGTTPKNEVKNYSATFGETVGVGESFSLKGNESKSSVTPVEFAKANTEVPKGAKGEALSTDIFGGIGAGLYSAAGNTLAVGASALGFFSKSVGFGSDKKGDTTLKVTNETNYQKAEKDVNYALTGGIKIGTLISKGQFEFKETPPLTHRGETIMKETNSPSAFGANLGYENVTKSKGYYEGNIIVGGMMAGAMFEGLKPAVPVRVVERPVQFQSEKPLVFTELGKDVKSAPTSSSYVGLALGYGGKSSYELVGKTPTGVKLGRPSVQESAPLGFRVVAKDDVGFEAANKGSSYSIHHSTNPEFYDYLAKTNRTVQPNAGEVMGALGRLNENGMSVASREGTRPLQAGASSDVTVGKAAISGISNRQGPTNLFKVTSGGRSGEVYGSGVSRATLSEGGLRVMDAFAPQKDIDVGKENFMHIGEERQASKLTGTFYKNIKEGQGLVINEKTKNYEPAPKTSQPFDYQVTTLEKRKIGTSGMSTSGRKVAEPGKVLEIPSHLEDYGSGVPRGKSIFGSSIDRSKVSYFTDTGKNIKGASENFQFQTQIKKMSTIQTKESLSQQGGFTKEQQEKIGNKLFIGEAVHSGGKALIRGGAHALDKANILMKSSSTYNQGLQMMRDLDIVGKSQADFYGIDWAKYKNVYYGGKSVISGGSDKGKDIFAIKSSDEARSFSPSSYPKSSKNTKPSISLAGSFSLSKLFGKSGKSSPSQKPSNYSVFSARSISSGFSGKSGFSAKSGRSNLSGKSSTSGFSGKSGSSGLSGKSGFSGSSAPSGKSSSSGFSTKSNFSGISNFSGKSGSSSFNIISTTIPPKLYPKPILGDFPRKRKPSSREGSTALIHLGVNNIFASDLSIVVPRGKRIEF